MARKRRRDERLAAERRPDDQRRRAGPARRRVRAGGDEFAPYQAPNTAPTRASSSTARSPPGTRSWAHPEHEVTAKRIRTPSHQVAQHADPLRRGSADE